MFSKSPLLLDLWISPLLQFGQNEDLWKIAMADFSNFSWVQYYTPKSALHTRRHSLILQQTPRRNETPIGHVSNSESPAASAIEKKTKNRGTFFD
jgi:hypothetical protein